MEHKGHKFFAMAIYAAAGLATANWLEYGLEEDYGLRILMFVASAGSATLLLSSALSLFNLMYGTTLGLFAACLSWPYFGLLLMLFPYDKLIWFIEFHHHGADQVVAVVCLLIASAYTAAQRKHHMQFEAKRFCYFKLSRPR